MEVFLTPGAFTLGPLAWLRGRLLSRRQMKYECWRHFQTPLCSTAPRCLHLTVKAACCTDWIHFLLPADTWIYGGNLVVSESKHSRKSYLFSLGTCWNTVLLPYRVQFTLAAVQGYFSLLLCLFILAAVQWKCSLSLSSVHFISMAR